MSGIFFKNTAHLMTKNLLSTLWFILLCLFGFAQTKPLKASCEPVRTDAIFGNNMDDWEAFLKTNINPSIPVQNCAPAGKFYVEVYFLVGKDGRVESVKPRTNIGYGMEEELASVIQLSPRWKPATQNGRPCRMYRCETFLFVVDDAHLL